MKLAQLFSDFEEELIRQGEEAESLSFVYRILKNLSLRTLFCPPAGSDGRGRSICKRNFPTVSSS